MVTRRICFFLLFYFVSVGDYGVHYIFCDNHFIMGISQIDMLYILNLYSNLYQLCLNKKKKKLKIGTSLAVQWLRLQASTAGGVGSISGGGNKIMHDVWCGKKKKD